MSYTESHIIQLSSLKATQKNNGTYLSDVNFSLQGLLKKNKNILSKNISVLHAQFPFTFYGINETNNVIKYQIGTGSIFTSYIPYGNYNATTLINALALAFATNSVVFNITFNKITGLVTFTHDTEDFTFYQSDNSILPIIGFLNNNYTSTALSLTAIYPLNTLGALNFQIHSNQLITKNFNSIQGGQSTLLATIPINVPSWGLIVYDNNTNVRNVLYNDVINNIDIQIFDNYGYLVNFNNSDWEITLILDINYKQDMQLQDMIIPFLLKNSSATTNVTEATTPRDLGTKDLGENQTNLEEPINTPNTKRALNGDVPLGTLVDDMELYLLSQ